MSPGFTLHVSSSENSPVEQADWTDLTPVHSSSKLSSPLERCILRSPDSGDILLWVSTPKVANTYTPLTKGTRDTPLSADHTRRGSSTASELKSMIDFEAEVINPMAKRRAAEQLTMMQVKSFAQRCKVRANMYTGNLDGDQFGVMRSRGYSEGSIDSTDQSECESPQSVRKCSTTAVPRISVASTAASLDLCEETDDGTDICVGFNDASEAVSAQQQHFSREALIRTNILRPNAVDFTLKFAETVEIIEKSLRLKYPNFTNAH